MDQNEFEQALNAAAPKLWAIAMAMSRNHHVAQDLVQEAGMIAWKKRDTFIPETSFNAWTGQIVRNLALRHGRDSTRRATLALAAEPAAAPSASEPAPADYFSSVADTGATSPAALGDRLAIDDRLADALTQLSEVARSCFLLRSVENHSYKEISELLDIPVNTAMSHVHRSRHRVLLAMSHVKEGS